MKLFSRSSLLVFAALLFTGCGGGGDGEPTLTPSANGGTSSGGGTSGGDGSTPTPIISFGSLTGSVFTAGTIASNKTSLEAGQSASLSVSFVDQNNTQITDAADVLFSSACAGSGLAEFEPAIGSNSSGTVSTTYTARGCNGADKITAKTSLNGTSYSATIMIQTIPAPLGSIGFKSATPNIIGIKGSGAIPEQSIVVFKVTNTAGGPVANQDVSFTLNNTTGGISLNDGQSTLAQDTTDANGEASVTVASGTVATSVRITATANQGTSTSSAQSSALVITSGIPDQDSFSLSASTLNIEGLDYDGTTTELTIRAADRYNNPAPDGTAIAFQAEGASIQGSCIISKGACSVTLTSQNPKPAGDGRVTVLATAIGEESFNDANPSNGRYDDAETFTDLAEAYRDDNENNAYDQNTEPYVDFNNNGSRDGISGTFEGLLCNGPTKCNATQTTLTIRESIVIILSGSSFNITGPTTINLGDATTPANGSGTFEIFDTNGQIPPAGTTIVATTDHGTLSGVTSYIVPSTNYNQLKPPGNLQYTFNIKPAAKAGTGTLTLTVTTPKGIISRAFANVVQLVDKP